MKKIQVILMLVEYKMIKWVSQETIKGSKELMWIFQAKQLLQAKLIDIIILWTSDEL